MRILAILYVVLVFLSGSAFALSMVEIINNMLPSGSIWWVLLKPFNGIFIGIICGYIMNSIVWRIIEMAKR